MKKILSIFIVLLSFVGLHAKQYGVDNIEMVHLQDASRYVCNPENILSWDSVAVIKLLAVAEAYPDLKADTHFSELQAQLEGTENRIAESRRVFNETAKEYNRKLRTFPNNILGGIFGLSTRSYFESEYGANKAPKVEF